MHNNGEDTLPCETVIVKDLLRGTEPLIVSASFILRVLLRCVEGLVHGQLVGGRFHAARPDSNADQVGGGWVRRAALALVGRAKALVLGGAILEHFVIEIKIF